jgi:hypothetical protein
MRSDRANRANLPQSDSEVSEKHVRPKADDPGFTVTAVPAGTCGNWISGMYMKEEYAKLEEEERARGELERKRK